VLYSYPAIIERGEDGRYVVRFPDFAEALTDGADKEEALVEAADCLSEALASRIVDDEEIPSPSPLERGQYRVSPDPIIALKAALHAALRRGGMTIAHLADRLGMADWHQAARLIDPKRPSKLRRLAAALDALGYKVEITVSDSVFREQACEALAAPQVPKPEIADRGTVRLGAGCITAEFPPLRQPKPEIGPPRYRAAALPPSFHVEAVRLGAFQPLRTPRQNASVGAARLTEVHQRPLPAAA
jgi:predicted RNase H-like HicB family nuclease